jgi:phenylacetate-CoA ligase
MSKWQRTLPIDIIKGRRLNDKIGCLMANLNLTSGKLKSYQQRQLDSIINHAIGYVPYYKAEYENRKELCSIQRFDILKRASIQAQPSDFIPEKAKDLRCANTSGSTGVPLVYYYNDSDRAWDRAALARALNCWGIKYGERFAQVWGLPLNRKQRTIKRIKYLANNGLILNVFDLTSGSIDRYLKMLKAWQPKYIYGYVSGIHQMALHITNKQPDFRIKSLKLVITTSEMLYPEQRKIIEKAFGCRISQEYGAAEAAVIAFECPRGSLHVNSDNVYLEADENKHAIVTTLRNYAMPLIRYDLGDIIEISEDKCPCGLPLPVISQLQGRESTVLGFGGAMTHSEIFDYLAREYMVPPRPRISNFRVTRLAEDLFRVEVVPAGNEFRDVIRKGFSEKLAKVFGKSIRLEFMFTKTIKKDPSGKFRFFVDGRSHA